MYIKLLITFVTIWKLNVSLNVIGTIDKDCQFYYRKLSHFPSTLATIEYFVRYNQSSISPSVVMYIYTTEDNIDLRTNCKNKLYGQLQNEDLYMPL